MTTERYLISGSTDGWEHATVLAPAGVSTEDLHGMLLRSVREVGALEPESFAEKLLLGLHGAQCSVVSEPSDPVSGAAAWCVVVVRVPHA